MKIVVNYKKEKIKVDCVLQNSASLLPGNVQEEKNAFGENLILIGTAGPLEETFEECLRSGLESALLLAETRGYTSLAVDGETFVSELPLVPYVGNTLLDLLTECGDASRNKALELRLFLPAEGDAAILQRVESAVETPALEVETQVYTDWREIEEKLERHLEKDPQKASKGAAGEKSFRDTLAALLAAVPCRKYSEIYKKCGISKSTFSKCMNFTLDYKPSKPTVAAFAIGLGLDEERAQMLYHSAGYHLGYIDLTDRIVRFFIQEKIYDVYEVNCCLAYYGLPLLGERSREERSA